MINVANAFIDTSQRSFHGARVQTLFSFLISLLLCCSGEGTIGSGDTGPTCSLCSIIGGDIVECMTCLRLIRQTIFAIVTMPIALGEEISARRWKFSYRELVTIQALVPAPPRFLSQMEEDIPSTRSRVFSRPRTIAADPDFHVYLLDIVPPLVQFSTSFSDSLIFFLSKFPNRSNGIHKASFLRRSKYRLVGASKTIRVKFLKFLKS